MTLIIEKGITLRKGYIGTDDPDAEAYIAAVEAADEAESPGVGALETATKVAIHSFVKGCKADGIWPAIKASCILAGARTLDGALVPLVGAAPTNPGNVFSQADYGRKTGLTGDGLTKYIVTNATVSTSANNSFGVWIYTPASVLNKVYIGSSDNNLARNVIKVSAVATTTVAFRNATATDRIRSSLNIAGFAGTSRESTTSYINRVASDNDSVSAFSSIASTSPYIFARNSAGTAVEHSLCSIGFYWIGESLDLALLDARVTDLINAIGAAIP
jgi:hypothetical protein